MALQRQLRVLERQRDSAAEAPLRVAFATSDLKHVDQHFGSAERFALYDVTPEQVTLIKVAEFGDLAQDGNENKLLEKFGLLEGCAAVYSQAVGPSAVRQLLSLEVQPLKVGEGSAIAGLIEAMQREWRDGPGGWLSRALGRRERDPLRFDAMDAEGWED